MRRIGIVLMLANAALFLLGAIQHSGIAIGPLHEPVIIPAAIVESICAVALIAGALSRWRAAGIAGNLIAITGVIIGMIALAAGRGPRTASNDLSHRFMLALAGAALLAILVRRKSLERIPQR